MLNKNIKAFIVYITFFSLKLIYLAEKSKISLFFIVKIRFLAKYLSFIDVFSKKSVKKLLEYLTIYEYTIIGKENK